MNVMDKQAATIATLRLQLLKKYLKGEVKMNNQQQLDSIWCMVSEEIEEVHEEEENNEEQEEKKTNLCQI